MSREFKFRLWSKSENCFVNPNLLEVWDESGKMTPYEFVKTGKLNPIYMPIENYVIQQYTGLTDKNGKEIFEGDIVKEHRFDDWTDKEGYEYRGVVRHKIYDTCDEKRKFSGFITFPNELENKNYSGNPIHSDCEVIGNIFENSELLNY